MAGLVSSSDLGAGLPSRYELIAKIASGGMATVYVGRLRGAGGFWRTVAIKRAHPHLLESPAFKTMLVDEARLASRLHHPNVVAVLDVEELAGELLLVMDYVEGTSLSDLIARGKEAGRRMPARIAVRVALDACAGLHAAHELCDENGNSLGLVHRDVSPHNILVGLDGTARLADFGIAKHAEGGVSTTTGALKGKLGYMAPEYVEHGRLDARSDVFSMGVVIWEALADRRLFRGPNELETLKLVAATDVPRLSSVAPGVGERLDDVLATALAHSPDERFANARALGTALETAARRDDLIATPAEVGAYVRDLAGASLEQRRALVRERTASVTGKASAREATGRVTRPMAAEEIPAPPPEPPAPETPAIDRPTVPDKPPSDRAEAPGETEAPARAESSLTLGKPISFNTPPRSRPSRWRSAVGVGVAAAMAGVIGVLVLRPRLDATAPTRPATSATPVTSAEASATAAAAPVTAPPAPTVAAEPAASAAAPRASGSAGRPLWGKLPRGTGSARGATTSTPAEAPVQLPVNPY